MNNVISLILIVLIFSFSNKSNETNKDVPEDKTNQESEVNKEPEIKNHPNFESKYLEPRNVDVWLPKGYDKNSEEGYTVLYMHDGQNIFIPELSYTKIDWGVDEAMAKLLEEGKIRKTIVVGVWNTDKRFPEYMPQEPFSLLPDNIRDTLTNNYSDKILSDNYLKFLVEELKPFIDSTYNTKTDVENTYIMGSSMGGLISWYALCKYPEVFGGAGCVSTHWPITIGMDENDETAGNILIEYCKNNLPKPAKHKIYFDYGTATLDQHYGPYQLRMDAAMKEIGYKDGVDWITKKFEGAEHSEASWKKRVHIPLEFLLK